jgi:hypothetical protein
MNETESGLTIRSPQILNDELDFFRRLIQRPVETLKVLLAVESNYVIAFVDESDSNVLQWNVKQFGDFRGKISPRRLRIKICESRWGVGLLELLSCCYLM